MHIRAKLGIGIYILNKTSSEKSRSGGDFHSCRLLWVISSLFFSAFFPTNTYSSWFLRFSVGYQVYFFEVSWSKKCEQHHCHRLLSQSRHSMSHEETSSQHSNPPLLHPNSKGNVYTQTSTVIQQRAADIFCDRLSSRYAVASMYSIVVLCQAQMTSWDFRPIFL